MTTKELIQAGRLVDARTQLTEEIKAVPTNINARTLLFQVLAFCGEWDRAERHLDILAMQNVKAETGVQVYKNLIAAERKRLEVYRGERCPSFMTATPPFLELFFAFRKSLTTGNITDAELFFAQVEDQFPVISGVVNGVPFGDFRDGDSLLSHFMEVFIHDNMLWIPIASLRELSLQPPKTLLELLWIPARIVTWEGLTTNCFLPVIYPDSAAHENELVRMGKMTDWYSLGGGFYRGMGQHVFLIDDEEKGLLELRDVTFTASAGVENQ
jgi:type VI secretion system protein ImpE